MDNTMTIYNYVAELNRKNKQRNAYTAVGKGYKQGYEEALNAVQRKIDNMIDDFFKELEASTYNK